MKPLIVSQYKNNSIASKKKHIYSRLLDYFGIFVFTYIFFNIFYAIGIKTPVVVSLADRLNACNTQLTQYIDNSHLQRVDENNNLISLNDGAHQYLEYLCKTSAYVHNKTFPIKQEDGTFIEKAVNVEETFAFEREQYKFDDLSYYFYLFKSNEPSLNNYVIDGVDYKDDKETYLYEKLMNVDSSLFVTADNQNLIDRGGGISRFVVLTESNTDQLLNYYHEDRADLSLYTKLFTYHVETIKKGIGDVENNSAPYKGLIDVFSKAYADACGAVAVIYYISYTFVYVLYIVIMRLIGKEWITLGQKVMKLGLTDINENQPSIVRIILYNLVNYLLFSSSSLIGLYFMGMLGVTSIPIIGIFNLLWLLISILTLNIISLFMPFFNKNRNDLSTLVTGILVKDKTEFDGSADVINALENATDGTKE